MTVEKVDYWVNKARNIAKDSHKDQKDKSGNPYFDHVERVAKFFNTYQLVIIGYLHDALEDTKLTELDLIDQGFGQDIVEAVVAISRWDEESYKNFIKRVALNPLAKEVKIRDLRDNLRSGCPPSLKTRYEKALVELGTHVE